MENGDLRDDLNTFEERKRAVKERIKALARLQREGLAPSAIDTEMLYLFCVALTIYPSSFPQSVYVATGEDAYSSAFQERYCEALERLAPSSSNG